LKVLFELFQNMPTFLNLTNKLFVVTGQGAISTATFTGVRLNDLLAKAGLKDAIKIQNEDGIEHVRFYAVDGMSASIGIEKAMNPYGDCIIAYEMNGEPLSREHGYPLRAIVPGYAAIRNVKWINKIELSKEEAEGPWQRGLNYKILPPSVVDANEVDLSTMPSINEASLFSGITKIEPITNGANVHPGEIVIVKVSGWAWAGGGRNIVRVDVTGNVDGGDWATAQLLEGSKQPYGRAWAWTFWECELPVKIQEDGAIHIASKAIDMAFNVQPEKCDHMWNVRGLCNNSWYRAHIKVV
jgi:sulfite oxidase